MRFRGYAYVVVIDVGRCPFDGAVCFDVAFCAVGLDVSVEMARVAVLQHLGEPHLGIFDLYMVKC